MDLELTRVPCPLCRATKSAAERSVNQYTLERCSTCTFVFVNPQPTPEALNRLYKTLDVSTVDLYANIAPSKVAGFDRTLTWIEGHAPNKGRLLDFACAAGHFFERAQQRGWEAHGTDLGDWAATAAAARGLANLHVGSLHELAFPDGWFDVVHAAQVFEHLTDPYVELAELRRILKPGGLLYVDVPNYQTLPIMLGKDDFRLNMPPQHLNFFTPRTLTKMLSDGDFVEIATRSNGGLKWENLIGRPITSDILAAYDHKAASRQGATTTFVAQQRPSGMAARLKTLLRDTVVDPLLYQGMKVGMNLVALARRPT